ncbi:MAG TPA: hypothetical protein ENJ37_10140 [Deltaproteobacteria bacterium]|nr:hypothetical protein [Deltaproteobacteria bacterium]
MGGAQGDPLEGIPLLHDITVLMAVSVPISILFARAGLPTIIGFLVTGIIIGPSGLGLVTTHGEVEMLAEIGIVLLLFTIGIEFSLTKLLSIRRAALLGGGLQVTVTMAVAFAAATAFGLDTPAALVIGFAVALSSSAIVLKLLVDSGEASSSHGNQSVAILLFQDICVVLMVMVVQGMGEQGGTSAFALLRGLATALVMIAAIIAAASYLIPALFHHVARLRNREVFILTIVLVCLGSAWVAFEAGLSLAMGAFIAGLVISESEYSNQIVAEVLPFRDTFASLFFISVGMLLDARYFLDNVGSLVLLAAAVMAVKAFIVIAVGQMLRNPLRLSIIVGLSIAQVGEFSFILMKLGRDYGILSSGAYQTLLAVSIMTMAATPFVFQWAPAAALSAARLLGTVAAGASAEGRRRMASLSNHVVIIGYGLNGRNLARVLKEVGIAYLVMDMSPERVREAKKAGHRAYYGDASHPEMLRRMGIEKAQMLVVAIDDPLSTRRIVKSARDLNPNLSILVRTRYIKEVEELRRLGANQVIPEEFETSVEIFARVLRDYRVPANIIQNQIDLVRQEGYAMLRNPSMSSQAMAELTRVLEASVMDTFYVDEKSAAAGKSIGEIDLKRLTGATVMAVVRKGEARTNPPPDFVVGEGDIVVLLGSHAELNSAIGVLKGPGGGPPA